MDTRAWTPWFGFLGLDLRVWIPWFGFLVLDSWAWIPALQVEIDFLTLSLLWSFRLPDDLTVVLQDAG